MTRLRRGIAGLLVALALGAIGPTLPAQPDGPGFTDDLRESPLDREHWVVEQHHAQGDVVATEDGLRLSLTVRNVSDFFAHNVWLDCRLGGDFDARLSYELTEWPRASGVRLGLGVHPDPKPFGSTTLHGVFGDAQGELTAISERISLKRSADSSYPSGGQFYTAEMNGQSGRKRITTHAEGQLRITREGTTYKALFYEPADGVWYPTGQWSVIPELRHDEWVTIQLWGRERSPHVEVLVRDFSVTADEVACGA